MVGKEKLAYGYDNEPTRKSAQAVAAWYFELFRPASVIDVGCGNGTWLREWRASGVREIQGVEGLWGKDFDFVIPRDQVLLHDLAQPVHFSRKFDLAMSVEVAEHLPESAADCFIDSLAGMSDVVLFSAAVPHQGGWHHFNERWHDYWIDKFAARGFRCFDTFRHQFWNDERVLYWYRQNIMLFVRENRSDIMQVLHDYPPACPVLPCVHPILYLRRCEPFHKLVLRYFDHVRYDLRRRWEVRNFQRRRTRSGDQG